MKALAPWTQALPSGWKLHRLDDVADVLFSNVDKHTVDGEVLVKLCNYVDVYMTRASSHFIAYCLLSRYVLEGQLLLLTLRAAQSHLNAEELGSVLVALPPTRTEQEAICAFLDTKLADVKNIASGIETQIATLTAYRKSLIHECVTGQRRIAEADVQQAAAQCRFDNLGPKG